MNTAGVPAPLVTLWFANPVTFEEFLKDVADTLADTSEVMVEGIEIVTDVTLTIVDADQKLDGCGEEGARVVGGASQLDFGAVNSGMEFGLAEVIGNIADQIVEVRGVLLVSMTNVMVMWALCKQMLEANSNAPNGYMRTLQRHHFL